MPVLEIILFSPNTLAKAEDVNTNFARTKNVLAAIDDDNYGGKAMTASSKIKDDTITLALLKDEILNELLPVGMKVDFDLGTVPPNVGIPGGPPADPSWWPCDGTEIVAPSSGLNGATTTNHNDPGGPLYAPWRKGAVSSDSTPKGAPDHYHSGITDDETLSAPWENRTQDDNGNHHRHGFTTDSKSNEPLHAESPVYIKL